MSLVGFLQSSLPAGCGEGCGGQGHFPFTEGLWAGIKVSLSQGMRLGQASGQSLAPGRGHQRVQGEASACRLEWGNAESALIARRTIVSRTWKERAKEIVSTTERWRGWNLADKSQ